MDRKHTHDKWFSPQKGEGRDREKGGEEERGSSSNSDNLQAAVALLQHLTDPMHVHTTSVIHAHDPYTCMLAIHVSYPFPIIQDHAGL